MKIIQNSALALLGITTMANGLVARSAGTANDVVSVILSLITTEPLSDAQKAIFPTSDYLQNGLFVTSSVVNTQIGGGYLSTTVNETEALIFTKNVTQIYTQFNNQTQYLTMDGNLQIKPNASTAFDPNKSVVEPSSSNGYPGFYACFGTHLTRFWGLVYSGPFPTGPNNDSCINFQIQEWQDIPQATKDYNKVLAATFPPLATNDSATIVS